MMNQLHLVDASRNRRYLLEKTQHIVGGFGKAVGEPPGTEQAVVPRLSSIGTNSIYSTSDLLHSYFGLVSLAFHGEDGLDGVDPALCLSHRAAGHLHSLPWWKERS